MSRRIEDYALLSDCQTAALVSRDGSIDWLCVPRFDSGACFAALLGNRDNGRWFLGPVSTPHRTVRAYRDGTMVLETEHHTDEGVVAVIDCMPPRTEVPDLVRIVEGRSGRVRMRTDIVFRFDYGSLVPWVTHHGDVLRAIAGPDKLRLHTGVPLHGRDFHTEAEFVIGAGERVEFELAWYPSYVKEPPKRDAGDAVAETERFWREWVSRCGYDGPWRDAVLRSLVTLKALTYSPTGGIVASPTTSLPEHIGGSRNWDYRYCWLRDATFTLLALTGAGFFDEACAWREWLLRAVAGDPSQLQIMYSITGERRLPEFEVSWLRGFANSRPVRIGNAAHEQFQLDVYGELLDAMFQSRQGGVAPEPTAWNVERALLEFLETAWTEPDEGIWEVRGPRRHFTHSRVMAWVAVDRAIQSAQQHGLEAPLDRWIELRDRIHDDVCRNGYDPDVGAFVQSYGSKHLDASLLLVPLVGFLPVTDERVRGTIRAIEKQLVWNGFVRRYDPESGVDGVPGTEGVFLPCSFWLAHAWAQLERFDEARELFERLLAVRNDVGLLSEEYDPVESRLVGNFPQAFSHVALINTAFALHAPTGHVHRRSRRL